MFSQPPSRRRYPKWLMTEPAVGREDSGVTPRSSPREMVAVYVVVTSVVSAAPPPRARVRRQVHGAQTRRPIPTVSDVDCGALSIQPGER